MIIGEKLLEYQILAHELPLPTTPQIAKESRDEFLILACLLPASLRQELDTKDIRDAVYGFDSIRTIYYQSGRRYSNYFERVFNHPSSKFRFIREPESAFYGSLINLRSANRIISLNCDLFPEAKTNPDAWIMENANSLTDTQLGLLSGFPRTSVMDFHTWAKVITNRERGAYNGPRLSSDQWLLDSGKISNRQFVERVRNGLSGQLTDEEIEKVISASKIRSSNCKLGAVIFSSEDLRVRTISLEFMEYLSYHPDYTLEKFLGSPSIN